MTSARSCTRQRLAQLDAAENGLCFGRIDFNDGEPRYIGRIGIRDEDGRLRPAADGLARADAARPFYLATPASPGGVRSRRHIKTRASEGRSGSTTRCSTSPPPGPRPADGLTGEAALLAALNASRTGRMTRHRRDHPGRAGPHHPVRAAQGVLVVQGGPGTGKTAVALHRAAFLLYTLPASSSATRACWSSGPTPTFLRYIGPGAAVARRDLGAARHDRRPVPGDRGDRRRDEPVAAARVKGRLEMAQVVAAAVRERQGAARCGPGGQLRTGHLRLGGRRLRPDRGTGRAGPGGRTTRPAPVRRTGCSSTRSRGQAADRIGFDALGGGNLLSDEDLAEHRARSCGTSAQVRAALESFWPPLTPQGCSATCSPSAGPAGGRRRRDPCAGGAGRAGAPGRRRVDPGGRAAAGRGGGTARRGRPGGRAGANASGAGGSPTRAGCWTSPTARGRWT